MASLPLGHRELKRLCWNSTVTPILVRNEGRVEDSGESDEGPRRGEPDSAVWIAGVENCTPTRLDA